MYRLLPIVAFAIALLPQVTAAQPLQPNACPPGQSPSFRHGFAELHARLGDTVMGRAVTCEFPDSRGTGDVLQLTTNGLAFWRKSTNAATYTNGNLHFALAAVEPSGILYWFGTSIDPPDYAAPVGQGAVQCIYVDQPDC